VISRLTRRLAAVDIVRTEAVKPLTPLGAAIGGDALLLVSGWSTAKTALDRATVQAEGTPGGGVELAPWLPTGGILIATSSEVLPLTLNPQDLNPRQYAFVVSTAIPGERLSSAGYLGWTALHPLRRRTLARRSTAPRVNVPMGMDGDMDMGSEPSGA
jgi:hypothetical protein